MNKANFDLLPQILLKLPIFILTQYHNDPSLSSPSVSQKENHKKNQQDKSKISKSPPSGKKTEIKQTHNETKPEVHFLLGFYTWGWSLIWSMVDELCDILPASVFQCLIIYTEILGP